MFVNRVLFLLLVLQFFASFRIFAFLSLLLWVTARHLQTVTYGAHGHHLHPLQLQDHYLTISSQQENALSSAHKFRCGRMCAYMYVCILQMHNMNVGSTNNFCKRRVMSTNHTYFYHQKNKWRSFLSQTYNPLPLKSITFGSTLILIASWQHL